MFRIYILIFGQLFHHFVDYFEHIHFASLDAFLMKLSKPNKYLKIDTVDFYFIDYIYKSFDIAYVTNHFILVEVREIYCTKFKRNTEKRLNKSTTLVGTRN